VNFEALKQTPRLHLVSGPVDKKFFFLIRNSLSRTVHTHVLTKFSGYSCTKFSTCTGTVINNLLLHNGTVIVLRIRNLSEPRGSTKD
jgi:hypothetical protein